MYICNQCGALTDLAVSFVLASVSRHDFYFLLISSFSFFASLFRRVRKIAKSDYYIHVCASVCMNNSAVTGRILMKFDI
jgi:hypothetical protein